VTALAARTACSLRTVSSTGYLLRLLMIPLSDTAFLLPAGCLHDKSCEQENRAEPVAPELRILYQGGDYPDGAGGIMIKFLLWCILFILCWPLAVMAIVLYPIVWLVLLPFRLAGIAVHGALELVVALISLPVRMLRAI
jgi:hypothetical protein